MPDAASLLMLCKCHTVHAEGKADRSLTLPAIESHLCFHVVQSVMVHGASQAEGKAVDSCICLESSATHLLTLIIL